MFPNKSMINTNNERIYSYKTFKIQNCREIIKLNNLTSTSTICHEIYIANNTFSDYNFNKINFNYEVNNSDAYGKIYTEGMAIAVSNLYGYIKLDSNVFK